MLFRNSTAGKLASLSKALSKLTIKPVACRSVGTLIKLNPSKLPAKFPGEYHDEAVAKITSTPTVQAATPNYSFLPTFLLPPQVAVKDLHTGEESGTTMELDPYLFACPPRKDILHRMVVWQLAKRRQGTHKTKDRWEVAYSGRKIYQQKGTGRARHGDRGAPVFRGGGHAKPIRPRDYSFKLNKKVRQLAFRMALTTKLLQERLFIVESIEGEGIEKTKNVAATLSRFGVSETGGVLVIDVDARGSAFERGCSNLHYVDLLPVEGLNVYDMLRREKLIITKRAIESLTQTYAAKQHW